MKTAELTGAALDYAVAKAEGLEVCVSPEIKFQTIHRLAYPALMQPEHNPHFYPRVPRYSEDHTGDDIIDRAGISVVIGNDLYFPQGNEKGEHYEKLWLAFIGQGPKFHGRTRREAGMRCFVASHLGDEVDIPGELL